MLDRLRKFFPLRLPYRDDSIFSALVLAVFTVPIVFTLFTIENFEVVKLSVLLVLVGFALVLWLMRAARGVDASYHGPFFALLILFVGWVTLSALFSFDPVMSLAGQYPRMTGGLLFYGAWAVFIVLLYANLNRERAKFLIRVLVVDAFIIAAVSLLQSFSIGYYEGFGAGGLVRAPGTLGNPNFTAMFLAAVVPFGFVVWSESRSYWGKIFWGVAVFLMLWGIAALTSRGALLGLAAAGGILMAGLLVRYRSKRLLVAAAAGVVISFLLSWASLEIARPGTIANTINRTERNVDLRVYSWGMAVDAMAKHPFFGTGPGQFHIFVQLNQERHMAPEASIFDDAHSLFLHIGATAGPFAAVVFALLTGMALYIGTREFWRNRDVYALAGVAALISFQVSAAFTPVSVSCYVLLGVLLVLLFYYESRQVRVLAPRFGVVAGSLLGVVLIVWGVAVIASESVYYRGRLSYFAGQHDRSYRLLKLATLINPAVQEYRIYLLGSAIKVGRPDEEIDSGINALAVRHANSAATHDRISGLHMLRFNRTYDVSHLEKALASLGKALEHEPYRAARYRRIAVVYFQWGKLEESKESVKSSLTLDENQIFSWALLARIYQIQNNREAMLYAVEKMHTLFPDNQQSKLLLEAAREAEDIRTIPISITLEEGRLE